MGGERWSRDRVYDRDRVEDDSYYPRGGRGRERSEDRFDRRLYFEDDYVRDRRHHDDAPYEARKEPARPPAFDPRVVMEKDRDADFHRGSSPRRPAFLRRQSSLDTYDRRPLRHVLEPRHEYPPPARREDLHRDDYRAPPYAPIPLPRARGLPPPGRREDRYYDDYRPSEPDYYPDEELHRHFPDRFREREVIRERHVRDRSRESRTTRSHTHRSSSRSSLSSSSSSAGGTTVRSEYPKKGKTKIPARLVSRRALIDLGYPYIEEENTIIVQKALGQENIDELLKLSEEYNRADQEVVITRSRAGTVVGERIEERTEYAAEMTAPPPPPPPPPVAAPAPPPPPPVVAPPPPPAPDAAPTVVDASPRVTETVEVDKTIIRASSPTQSWSSWDSGHHHRRHHHHHHHHDDGALVVVPRSRSRSRTRHDIRAEIKALERELVRRPKTEVERQVVRTERLPNGEVVIYEEEVERSIARPKPPRIEKDKKGPPPALLRAMLATLT